MSEELVRLRVGPCSAGTVKTSPWAVTFINVPWKTGTSALPEEFPNLYLRHYNDIDLERGILHFSPDIEVPIAPFMGQMGVAPPPEEGTLSTPPPRRYGGNMDWNFMVKGSILQTMKTLV